MEVASIIASPRPAAKLQLRNAPEELICYDESRSFIGLALLAPAYWPNRYRLSFYWLASIAQSSILEEVPRDSSFSCCNLVLFHGIRAGRDDRAASSGCRLGGPGRFYSAA